MGARSQLGEFEQLVLLAVLRLKDAAYGPRISAVVEEALDRTVSRGALYSSLSRLDEKGFLEWSVEATSSGRSGSRNRRFAVTEPGVEVLRASRSALLTLWDGLETTLGDGA